MSLFNELKRRNVIRVGIAYVLVGWLIMQVGEVMAPALHLPEWTDSFLAFVLILGFPIVLFFAWAFELTPEGLKREEQVDRSESITHVTGRKLNVAIGVLVVLAMGYFAWIQFRPGAAGAPATTATQPVAESTAAVTTSADRDRSVAVLPFQNRSADEENSAFFADGVHDELLTNLSRIEALKVISRTSVMQYRETTKTMREIGDELGASTLLEGGVQRAGDTVRINVQLIDAASDRHLWAETYDRQLTAENIFDIQSEIALAIADALEAALSPEERAQLGVRPTDDLAAYEHYLIGMQLRNRANWEALDQALEEARLALARDPEFGAAQTLKAQVYADLFATGARTLEAVSGPWRQAVDTAIELNPGSGTAEIQRAQWLWWNGEREQALASLERALALEPGNVMILEAAGNAYSRSRQPEKALDLLLRARELDPLSTPVLLPLARTWSVLDEPRKALEALQRLQAIDPSTSQGKGPMAGVYFELGELDQGLYWIFEAIAVDPADLDLWNWAVILYLDLVDPDRAGAWLATLPEEARAYPLTLSNQARLDWLSGDQERAEELARAHLQEGLSNRWGSEEVATRILLLAAMADQDAASRLSILETTHPEWFDLSLQVSDDNAMQVLNSSHLLLLADRRAQGEALLGAVLDYTGQPYALAGDRNAWRRTARAQAMALLGREDEALEELRRQVEAGYRVLWRWETAMNPNFKSLHDDPGFQALVSRMEEDMARQLESVRAMESKREVPTPPGEPS